VLYAGSYVCVDVTQSFGFTSRYSVKNGRCGFMTMGLAQMKFDNKQEFYVAARYRRMLSHLSRGLTVNEAADGLGIARSTALNYAEEIFLKHPEIRQRVAAYVLDLVGGDDGF
jgi:hypothetical protein